MMPPKYSEKEVRLRMLAVSSVLETDGGEKVILNYDPKYHHVLFSAEEGSRPGFFEADEFMSWRKLDTAVIRIRAHLRGEQVELLDL